MSAFARAAELFEDILALPEPEREAALTREPDGEVCQLVREMLAGEARPLDGLAEGAAGLGRMVSDALDEESGAESGEAKLALTEGPYRIHGVLARGGMGVVLRGRDEEIGRNVAIKVLRGQPSDGARLRFVEEAQVTGQLEHPGIVPIYHLGTDDEGRPFFAMKLVEGKTLASCLSERANARDERGRFLALFLQVCQTVAYAHARRVIHRDLKPANVMVGAFGEVQVLDWGLAKVLGSPEPDGTLARSPAGKDASGPAPETVRTRSGSGSASISGTVMGTPHYIPPEQAQGEVERLDPRADVFSLGAILCEILTGAPPFDGDRRAALEQAREGRVAPALERLASSGADPALIDLAQRSLGVSPEERPVDARELALEVERSLAAVEERAHTAELQAEATRARLHSERKARRSTLLLSTSAAVFSVVLVALLQWRAYERERDTQELSREVAAALERAVERIDVARKAPLEDRAPWDAAALAIETARGIHASGETSAEIGIRLEELTGSFQQERETRQRAAHERERDLSMVARLDEIRLPTGDGLDPYDYPRMEESYRKAFLDHGIDTENITAAKTLLATSDIAPMLAEALDQWALCHRTLAQGESTSRIDRADELLALASAADPDPTRDRVREAIRNLDGDLLRALASEAQNDATLAPESIVLLGGGLRATGDDSTAVKLLRAAARRHRGDFWISFYLALALRAGGSEGVKEAIPYFHAALGARPDCLEARHLLGQDLSALGQQDEALALFEELRRTDPDYGHGVAHIASLLSELRGWAHALPFAREAARLAPEDAYALARFGRALQETGTAWEAVAPMRRAAEIQDTANRIARYASALSDAGRCVEALAAYEQAFAQGAEDAISLYNAGSLAWNLGDLARAQELLLQCLASDPNFPQAHCNLGAVLRQLGRYEEARTAYERCDTLGRRTRGWSYPTAEWIAEVERAAIYAEEIEVYAEGAFDPDDTASALEIAQIAFERRWSVAASEFYLRIHEAGNGLDLSNMDLASRAAALASAGIGEDASAPNDDERRMQAARALTWLELLRVQLMRNYHAAPEVELQNTRSWLQTWQVDPVYEPLHDLAALPTEALRQRATELWNAVQRDLDAMAEQFDR